MFLTSKSSSSSFIHRLYYIKNKIFYLLYDSFALIFVCLLLAHFHIDFLHGLFLYISLHQIIHWTYFVLVLAIFLCYFRNTLLLFPHHFIDVNDFVLVFAIFLCFLIIITHFITTNFFTAYDFPLIHTPNVTTLA